MSLQPSHKPAIPRRSALYMPGANARALDKARTLDADCLLLDLEDAVAPDAKTQARGQICAALEAGGYGAREIVVRVNGLDTAWGHDDFAALAELAAQIFPHIAFFRDPAAAVLASRLHCQHPGIRGIGIGPGTTLKPAGTPVS